MLALARLVARAGLVLLLAFSLVASGWSVLRLARDPLIRPMAERGAAEFAAAVERATAREATPERIAARLDALLSEEPRNWIAIESVEEVAADRGLALPPSLTDRRAELWDEDSDWLAGAGRCLECGWDAGTCSLTNAFVCQAPVALTPIGDVAGISRAGLALATGGDVDEVDLALSVVGLGATALILASGGTSATLKLGTAVVKTARRMRLVSPRLTRLLADAARQGIDWQALRRFDTLSDPARLLRAGAIRPLASVVSDLGRINGAVGVERTLHLVRYVDGPDDARRIAEAAQSMGKRTVGRMEVLGKARFLRAGLRWSDEALALIAGIFGLAASVASAVGAAVQTVLLRRMRRALRRL